MFIIFITMTTLVPLKKMAVLWIPCRGQGYRRNNIKGTHWLVMLYFRKPREIEAMNSYLYLCAINNKNNILLIVRHCRLSTIVDNNNAGFLNKKYVYFKIIHYWLRTLHSNHHGQCWEYNALKMHQICMRLCTQKWG